MEKEKKAGEKKSDDKKPEGNPKPAEAATVSGGAL